MKRLRTPGTGGHRAVHSIRAKKMNKVMASIAIATLVSACSSSGPAPSSKKGKFDPKYGVSASARVAKSKSEFRKGGGHYKVGKPYKVSGRTYRPKLEPSYNKTGKASWYGDDFHGRLTANGEIFDMNTMTAAHPTMPLPSYARVTNLKNGRSVIVRVNDRGPYAHNRIIDLSKRVAEVLSFKNDGITNVRVKYISRARMDGEDARYLEASFRKRGQAIGDDRRAVPKEGEQRRAAPTIMMASAAPAVAPQPAQTQQKKPNFILAHVPGFQNAFSSTNASPMPAALAAPANPSAGWAPIDLVGDGYHPPAGIGGNTATAQMAQVAPIQLNYADTANMRVEAGHNAISRLFAKRDQATQTNLLKSALTKRFDRTKQRQSSASHIIGTYQAAYSQRLAREFAHLAAVDLKSDASGKFQVGIYKLKDGVTWSDIEAQKAQLGL